MVVRLYHELPERRTETVEYNPVFPEVMADDHPDPDQHPEEVKEATEGPGPHKQVPFHRDQTCHLCVPAVAPVEPEVARVQVVVVL